MICDPSIQYNTIQYSSIQYKTMECNNTKTGEREARSTDSTIDGTIIPQMTLKQSLNRSTTPNPPYPPFKKEEKTKELNEND